MKRQILISILLCGLWACNSATKQVEQQADSLLSETERMIRHDSLDMAQTWIDSLIGHYPEQTLQRRRARALGDSIRYIKDCRTLLHTDSALQLLSEEMERQQGAFTYVRQEAYQTRGNLFHQHLLTPQYGIDRSMLQPYFDEDMNLFVRCICRSPRVLETRSVSLHAGEDVISRDEIYSRHAYEANGSHFELLTLRGRDAYLLLEFIASHATDMLHVTHEAEQPYEYVLPAKDVNALAEAYELATLIYETKALQREHERAASNIARYTARQPR